MMERNREARRLAATNGVSRRRQRTSSFRDSPEEDGVMEMQETSRLRDRGNKKERDRERLSRNKRRRAERLMQHGSNREEGGEDSSEESVDDDEEDDEEESASARMLPPNPSSSSSHHHHRRNFPPAKVTRLPPLRGGDEMIGVPVPRKARTASTKRSHDYWNSGGGGGGEQIYRQASISPARPNMPTPPPPTGAPLSPSSSNVSTKKKTKILGQSQKQKPPKIAKPSSSTAQDEIEIEVAEVLYGLMRQSQGPSKQEMNASRQDLKDANGSTTDAKSRVSSPVSNSSNLAQNCSSSTNPLNAMTPKRKKPRPAKLDVEHPSNLPSSSSASKIEAEHAGKVEELKRNVGSVTENGGDSISRDLSIPNQLQKQEETNTISDPKLLVEESKVGDGVDAVKWKEDASLPNNESSSSKLDVNLEEVSVSKPSSATREVHTKREEKFQIDLMAPPPLKSSPDRDGLIDFMPDSKSSVPDVQMEGKVQEGTINEEQKSGKQGVQEAVLIVNGRETMVEEIEKKNRSKDRVFNLHQDFDKQGQDSGSSNVLNSSKQQVLKPHQQPKVAKDEPKMEKAATYTSMPFPMTFAGWPGALPPGLGLTGQVPLQGLVSMDGSVRPSGAMQSMQPPPFFVSQPRPNKCATHYYIAKSIQYIQNLTKVNPLWSAAANSASLYGTKPYNLNIMPPTEAAIMGNHLPGMFPSPNVNAQDKGQAATPLSSGLNGKEKGIVAANYGDGAQRKQLVLQQGTQPAVGGNMLPAPAFIFPITPQQAMAAAANQSGAVKSAAAVSNAATTSASNLTPGVQGKNSLAAAAPPTMSFGYQNMPPNEAQYMAVLQNNGYPFPIPSHVGGPPHFRGGTHAQAMPFLNGSFFPQMLHPAQLQQQQPQQPPHSQSQPVQQSHQNTSTSSGSSSSQKQQQNQHPRGNGSGAGSSQSHTASKNRPQQQSSQAQQNQHLLPHQARQLDTEMGGEDSSVTSDSRVSNIHKGVYDQSFALAMHPQNALMSAASLGGSGGNQGEKQQQQHNSLKGGMELLPSQSVALSFGSFNGAAGGLDIASLVQNHAFFQSLPEAARKQYQIAAAMGGAAQQKKTHQVSEEGKTVGDSSNTNEERKGLSAKGQPSIGQSLFFSRPDSNDQSMPAMRNTSMESAARALNLNRGSRPATSSTTTSSTATVSGSNAQLLQQQQQQQQLLFQLQKQQQQQHMQLQQHQQLAAMASRNKQSTATNANVYSDHLSMSSSVAGKSPNAHSVFPQAVVQAGSPSQSPQWKNSTARTTASSPSVAPTATSSLKNHSQQQGRSQQGHSQISFGGNSKSTAVPHGHQQPPPNNQSPSPPMGVGSPTHSISRSAGGSPRTTSIGSKVGPTPTLASHQQAKNSQSGPSRKSSPAGGRNVTSILSNSQVSNSPSPSLKSQSQQQQQQQQQQQFQQKQALQQFLLSNAYMQAQSPQSSNTTAGSSGGVYYNQRRQSDQQQQQQQHQVSSTSSGMLCPPLALSGASSSDPSKAVADMGNHMKGGIPNNAAQFAAHSAGNTHPLMSTPFQYMHPLTVAQIKPSEQKQPAGNDNLRACWQPEKR